MRQPKQTLWSATKWLFLAVIAGCLLYAAAYGQSLPPELEEIKAAVPIWAGTCTNAQTGEHALCIIAMSGEYLYLLVLNPDESVRECFRKAEGGKLVRIYPQGMCDAARKCV